MNMALKRQCTDGRKITAGDMRNFSESLSDDLEEYCIQIHEENMRYTKLLDSCII